MVTDPVGVWASTSLARFCSIYLFLRDLKFTAFWARIKVAMIAGLIFIFVKLYPALPDIVQKKVVQFGSCFIRMSSLRFWIKAMFVFLLKADLTKQPVN